MKCDELKRYSLDVDYEEQAFAVPDDKGNYMESSDVDAAIAELKEKLHDIDNRWNEQCKEIAQLKAENDHLKAKLESVQASAYADSVDAGMRERRLRRALWLARAKRALEKIAWFKLWNASISTMNPEDGARQEFDKWKKNLGKFLKKAEEYR